MMLERVRIAARALNIPCFKGNNKYTQRLLRSIKSQKSIRLHGKGNATLLDNYVQRMEQIRKMSALY